MNKVKILHHPLTANLAIYLIEETKDKFYVAKPVDFEFEELEEGAQWPKPTFQIPCYHQQEFMKALANALNEQGVQPDATVRLEAELKATKYHLRDMRRLVFKNEPTR